MDAREAIEQYKEWYTETYGVKPTEKLIKTFCKIKGIDIDKIREQEKKEVAKVEGDANMMKHSKLPWRIEVIDNEPTIVNADNEPLTAGVDDAFIVEACNNYEALETNYHNLLAEHQEICAIAQEQSDKIEKLEAKIDVLAGYLAGILKVMAKHKSLILKMPDEFKNELLNELDKVEKHAEGLKPED